MKFLGHGSAAHHRAPFQDRDLEAGGGQICRAHQAVVAAADDQCVALGICAACFAHIILLRTRKAIHSMSNWLQMLRQILVHKSLADWLAAALLFLPPCAATAPCAPRRKTSSTRSRSGWFSGSTLSSSAAAISAHPAPRPQKK